MIGTVTDAWCDASDDEARLTEPERRTLWQREFLDGFVFYDRP